MFVCLFPPFPTYPPQAMTGASRVMSAHFHHSLPLSVLPSASQDSSGTASTGREGQVSGEGPGIHATVKQKLKSSLEEQRRGTQLPGPWLTLWLPRPFLLTRVDKVRGEEVAGSTEPNYQQGLPWKPPASHHRAARQKCSVLLDHDLRRRTSRRTRRLLK